MTTLEIYQQQVQQLLAQKATFTKLFRDNATARSRKGKKARREAEQQLKRIDRQLDDVNRKILQLERTEQRTDRQENRQETKTFAYSQGIDPNASMWKGISSLGQSTANVLGGRGNLQNQEIQKRTEKQNSLFMLGGLLALILLIFKKK